jgi:hypothetical protein
MSTATKKVTTMSELRQPVAPEANLPQVRMGFNDLQGFELMQRAAKALSASTLVPPEYQGNLPNCLIALEMAQRIGASPLLVMQNLYIVHGRPGWSAKFLIASFNQCGRFNAIRFDWLGERGKDTWGCRAWALERSTDQRIEGPTITITLAKDEGWYAKKGSKWQTIPELMMMYRAAAWLVNTHAPEISMGLNTAEELGDVFDAEREASGAYVVTSDQLRSERSITEQSKDVPAPDLGQQQDAELRNVETKGGDAHSNPVILGSDATSAATKQHGAPPIDGAALKKRLETANDVDVLDADATLIDELPVAERDAMRNVYHARRKYLLREE